jgi:hypothetical protein
MGTIAQRVVVTSILNEKCLQLNAQVINVLLRRMCAELVDDIIFGDEEPIEDAHLIWTKLCKKFGTPKYDDPQVNKDITNTSSDLPHLCLMSKKEKKKKKKARQDEVKQKVVIQEDDQIESDIEIEDSYTLDHLSDKDKLILMKLVEKNDELEQENEK